VAKFKDRDLNELRDILNQLAEESGSNSYTTSSEVRKYLNDKNIKTAKELTDEIKRQHLELRKLYSSAKGLYNVFKANLDELNDFKKGPIEATQALNNLVKLSTKLKDDAIGINRLNDKDLKRLITKIELAKEFSDETLRSMETNGQTDKEAYTQLKKTENEQKELLQTAKDRLIVENEVGKRLGLSGAAIQSMTTILKTFNLTNLSGIDELNDELKETYNCALDFDVYQELSKFFNFSKVNNLKLSTICGLRALGMKPVKINEFLKANELSIIEARELVDKSNKI